MTEEEHKDVVRCHEAGHIVVTGIVGLPIGRFVWTEGLAAQLEPLTFNPSVENFYKSLVVKAAASGSQSFSPHNNQDTDDESFHDDEAQISKHLGLLYGFARDAASETGKRFCTRRRFKEVGSAMVRTDAYLLLGQKPVQALIFRVVELLSQPRSIEGEDLSAFLATERQVAEREGQIVNIQLFESFRDLYYTGGLQG
jgi:hypothetical protein